MSTDATPFEMPPVTLNSEGEERSVGYEFEFAGLDLEGSADAVRSVFGGRIVEAGHLQLQVVDTSLGAFEVVVDSSALRDRRYLDHLEELGISIDRTVLERPLDRMISWFAELVVPFEIVTPPIPLSQMAQMDALRAELAARKAQGTGASVRYAMGLHINPEVPSLEGESILRHLQAFLLLYDWLERTSDIDFTRSLTPYIDPFPEAYRDLVLSSRYTPSLDRLAADYIEFNATRNRPLDLHPLFVHLLGREILVGVPEDEPLSPRPTYHYRLPNCRLDEPTWRIAEEWNRWVEVERLAAAEPDELWARGAELLAEPSREGGLWQRLKDRTLEALADEVQEDDEGDSAGDEATR